MRKVLVMALAFGAIASLNAACTGDDDDDGHSPPDSITISGGTTVTVGSSLQLTATAVGGEEPGDITASSTWTSSSSGVATVSATGLVTGVAAGTTTISAEHDEVVGQVVLTVSTGSAATFNATVSAPWAGTHNDGQTYFMRIVDVNTTDVVHCTGPTNFTNGGSVNNVVVNGVLVSGHTYRAEVVANVGSNAGEIDSTDHKYQTTSNVGPIAANATFNVPHGTTASTWANGPACP